MMEITSEEQNKVRRMKRTEDSLRDLWDKIKCTNIQIIGVPEEEEKKKGYEKTFEGQNKIERMKRIEDSLRDLWDHITRTNIRITGVPGEEKKKGYEKIFEEIIVENFPNMEKEIIKSRRHKESHTG